MPSGPPDPPELLGLPAPDPAWFLRPDGTDGSAGLHGVAHTRRVVVHAAELSAALGVAPWEREAAVLAALWHDVGRTDDLPDYFHGAKSAGKVVGLGLHRGRDRGLVEVALYAVTHHSGDEKHGERAAAHLPDPAAALRVFRLLKDADGLDRVRLNRLDTRYLRFPVSRERVARARELVALLP